MHYEKALVSSIIHLSLYIHLLFCTYYYLVYHQPHSLLPKALPTVILVMEFWDVWYICSLQWVGVGIFFYLGTKVFFHVRACPWLRVVKEHPICYLYKLGVNKISSKLEILHWNSLNLLNSKLERDINLQARYLYFQINLKYCQKLNI